MLFTKPVEQIEYDDVINFFSTSPAPKESTVLECKNDLPSNKQIAKSISAFANTYGGVLVIGINAPNGTPCDPFEGINYDKKVSYEEKIQNILLDSVKEPLFPEIHVCPPKKGKTFIIVRVPESELTPHRVENNTKIYIRTGDASNPVESASWDKVEWLLSKRSKSLKFKEYLLDESQNYFKEAFIHRGIDINSHKYRGIFSLRLIPSFPQYEHIQLSNLTNILSEIRISVLNSYFPFYIHQLNRIQNGLHGINYYRNPEKPVDGDPFEYIYINKYGLLYWTIDITRTTKEYDTFEIYLKDMIRNIVLFLLSSIHFYKKLGYWGSLNFSIQLKNSLGLNLKSSSSNKFMESGHIIERSYINRHRTFKITELNNDFIDLILDIVEDLSWSLGSPYFNESDIKKFLKSSFNIESK